MQLKIESLKLKNHKTKLEIFKMERELELLPSVFTEEFYNNNSITIIQEAMSSTDEDY